MSKFTSVELEFHALSGLVKYPDLFFKIDQVVKDKDFSNSTHRTIYSVIRNASYNKENLDQVILAHKLISLNIHFKDDIDINSYIESLYLSKVTEKGTKKAFEELVTLRVKKELTETADQITEFIKSSEAGGLNGNQIISQVDKMYHDATFKYSGSTDPINLFEDLESNVEELGNNPIDYEKTYLMGPFPTMNRIYGSLLRPASINLVTARTGVGKTSLSMFYMLHVAEKYKIPILHLDYSEMTYEELQMRAVCLFSNGKVPYHAVESGDWRKNAIWEKEVRSIWPRVKGLKMYYHDIGGMSPSEIIAFIRRFYYKEIGKNSDIQNKVKLLINYDYLKPFQFDPKTPEYKEMGHFVQDLKNLLKNDIEAAAWCSLQSNRSGITNNKKSADVDDSENIFSLSDRIIQQVTHAWIARNKVMEEMQYEHSKFGNMVLKCMKPRHLGKDFMLHKVPVKMPDGRVLNNYININATNFHFEDMGDLNNMTVKLSEIYNLEAKEKKEQDDGTL